MDDTRCRQFFLEPAETYHRQYEALRAFFVEGRPLQEIAQQLGYQESSLRVMVAQFRNQMEVNDLHPFLFSRGSGGRRGSPVSKRQYVRRRRRSLTAAP
jgi:DNA-binding NarL/FixJ family response regulator